MTKFISWLTGLLTLSLALFSFILSFNALTDLAYQHGVSIPWLFPFVVEFAVVIFSLNALNRSINGQDTKVQWTMIILSSLLAGTFNILHANRDMVSMIMAAMPSFFLLLSFESFLSLLRKQVKPVEVAKPEKVKPVKIEKVVRYNEATNQKSLSERQSQIVNMLGNKPIIQIAKELEISAPTVYKEINQLAEMEVIYKNGNGWKVK